MIEIVFVHFNWDQLECYVIDLCCDFIIRKKMWDLLLMAQHLLPSSLCSLTLKEQG